MTNGVMVRRDVWGLADWDPVVEWYAKAVAAMQARPIRDPRSWRYQAAIHDYDGDNDPNAAADDELPTSIQRSRYWSQCQHNTWFFLPWHRMYLAYFEQIVRATIVSLGGPEDWTLPYWNYSDTSNPNARKLPPAFRAAQMPDGQTNPLLIADRDPDSNAGNDIADDDDVDLVALTVSGFIGQAFGGSPGFGGPRTNFNHAGGPVGFLEVVPHGSMHVAVGGWMGAFNTAGLDPIFWLHHCNIDRLWEVWMKRNPGHLNPELRQWRLQFPFHNAKGQVRRLRAPDVVDTTAPPLLYRYEDDSDPLAGAREAVIGAMENPEMVGATDRPITLTAEPTTARLAIGAPSGPARAAVEREGRWTGPIYLNLENIKGAGQPTGYAVYVNLPPGADAAQHRELFAGILPMFGLAESSREDQSHAGSGLHYALEIGGIVRTLQARNDWDPNDIRVTFVPRRKPSGAARAAAPVEVGRISVYFA